jgi:hypothetical protein
MVRPLCVLDLTKLSTDYVTQKRGPPAGRSRTAPTSCLEPLPDDFANRVAKCIRRRLISSRPGLALDETVGEFWLPRGPELALWIASAIASPGIRPANPHGYGLLSPRWTPLVRTNFVVAGRAAPDGGGLVVSGPIRTSIRWTAIICRN